MTAVGHKSAFSEPGMVLHHDTPELASAYDRTSLYQFENGKQLISEKWVDQATSKQVPNDQESHSKIGIGAACYPEGHVESRYKHQDWDYAAQKVEAGAEFLITQLFYDWSDFLDMEDYLRNKRNVKVPIVPGILPFLNAAQIKRFTSLCGSKLPTPVRLKIEHFAHDDESVRQLGVEVCTEICAKLLSRVAGFHFYCLNRAGSSAEVLRNLGLAS